MAPNSAGHGRLWSEPIVSATDRMNLWSIVLEFVRATPARPFLMGDIEALTERLDSWYPSALWSSDRYAIQLQIQAQGPNQALEWASAHHRQAALDVGLPTTSTMVRAEVCTVEELERSWDEFDSAGAKDDAAPPSVLCDAVYPATRRMLAATTPAEISDIVIDFVTAIGARVQPGPPLHRVGMIDFDLSVEGDEVNHVTADSFSVAGLIIERSLPALLADARHVLARFQTHGS